MSEMIAGEFCWNELITTDTGAAKKFYGELFGWEASDMDMEDTTYTMFRAPGAAEGPEGMAAGMMKSPMPEMPPFWLSYVVVEDVAATLAKAESLGATVVKGVTEIPMGTLAVFTDPQGATFAIWKKKKCPDAG
jgi:predicted enzyme related to lactoylglutathione lyase